jgi:hypothetical protein
LLGRAGPVIFAALVVDEVDGAPEVDELLQAAASTASGTSAAAVAKRVRLVTGEYSFS